MSHHPDTPAGRRHYDTVADHALALVRKWGPLAGILVTLAALGSCAAVTATAFGFAPGRAAVGTRLTSVEDHVARLDTAQAVTKSIIADLVLLRCGDDGLNSTQRRICAKYEPRTP